MKTLLLLLIAALISAPAMGQVHDGDGLLNYFWHSPPLSYPDTLSHYQVQLLVNDVAVWANDSLPDTVLVDFYQMQIEGDSAVAMVRAVATQGNYSVSSWFISEACYYDTDSPINPPWGGQWIVNGPPLSPIRPAGQH